MGGVNEFQTMADALSAAGAGSSALHIQINSTSLSVLTDHFTLLKRTITHHDWTRAEEMYDDLVSAIKGSSPTRKNVTVLHTSSDFCRHLGGGRITCCKSGKDRTGMSVTLENCRLIGEDLGDRFDTEYFNEFVSATRGRGVRIRNCEKNIGKRKYCFNRLQNSMLPRAYQCPAGSGGGHLS